MDKTLKQSSISNSGWKNYAETNKHKTLLLQTDK